MGDVADMMLDGTLCSSCGDFLGDGHLGFPVECPSCAGMTKMQNKAERTKGNIARNERQRKSRCPECNKKIKVVGMAQHLADAHGKDAATELIKTRTQADALAEALRDIANWTDRWTSGDHPVGNVARKALAAYEESKA